MTLFQRIRSIVIGLFMIFAAALFVFEPTDDAYLMVIAVLSLGLAVNGIKDIWFYFTMARHMVGGKMILVKGVVVFDFALLTLSLLDVTKIYIFLYLIIAHAFSGVIEILRALEAKKVVEGPWKMKFFQGIVDFILALICLIYFRKTDTALAIFSIGLIYSAVMRITRAFRRTTFIFIK